LCAVDAHAFVHHAGSKEPTDDFEHAFVADVPAQTVHQHVVVHAIEEFLQINVHDDVPSTGHELFGLRQRIVCAASGSESVARLREGRIEDAFQHLQHRLLNQPIHNRGNAQLSHSTAGFGDLHPTHRLRLVTAVQQ
jgi:hypothetical protein